MGHMKTLTIEQMNREREADLSEADMRHQNPTPDDKQGRLDAELAEIEKLLNSSFSFSHWASAENREAIERLCEQYGYTVEFNGNAMAAGMQLRAVAPDKDQ